MYEVGDRDLSISKDPYHNALLRFTKSVMGRGEAFYDIKTLNQVWEQTPVIPCNQQGGWCKRTQNPNGIYTERCLFFVAVVYFDW